MWEPLSSEPELQAADDDSASFLFCPFLSTLPLALPLAPDDESMTATKDPPLLRCAGD